MKIQQELNKKENIKELISKNKNLIEINSNLQSKNISIMSEHNNLLESNSNLQSKHHEIKQKFNIL